MPVLSPENNDAEDATLLGWALCQTSDGGTTWDVNPGATSYINSDKIGDSGCQQWWNGEKPDVFDVNHNPNDSDLVDKTNASGMNFFNSLHGVNGAALGTLGIMVSYSLGTITATLVLLIVAVMVLLSKFLAIIFLVGLIFALVAGIFRADGWDKIGQSFMQMIGSIVIAAGAVFLLSLLLMFTRLIMNAGAAMLGGAGSPAALLWGGVSPIVAAIGINLLVKKLFKMPSPFSMKGGLAFASAAGAVGGSLGAGLIQGRGGAAGAMGDMSGGGGLREATRDTLDIANGASNMWKRVRPGRGRDGNNAQGFDGGQRSEKPTSAVANAFAGGGEQDAGGDAIGLTPGQEKREAREFAASNSDAPFAGLRHHGKDAGKKGVGLAAAGLALGAKGTLKGVDKTIDWWKNPGGTHGAMMSIEGRGGRMRQRWDAASAGLVSGIKGTGAALGRGGRKLGNKAMPFAATLGAGAGAGFTHGRYDSNGNYVESASRMGMLRSVAGRGNTKRMDELAKQRGIDLSAAPGSPKEAEQRRKLAADARQLGKVRRAETRQKIGSIAKPALKHTLKGGLAATAVLATGGVAAPIVAANVARKGIRYARGAGERDAKRMAALEQHRAVENERIQQERAEREQEAAREERETQKRAKQPADGGGSPEPQAEHVDAGRDDRLNDGVPLDDAS